jgi:predicted nucleic-acid-binding protein
VTPRLWVDANILLRFLTGDPRDQAEQAAALMRRAEQGEVILIVTALTLAEVFWVLRSFYGYRQPEIARVLVPLLGAEGIEVEDRELLIQAVELTAVQKVDLADALLALQAQRAGEIVCTFDSKDFRRLPGRWQGPGAKL